MDAFGITLKIPKKEVMSVESADEEFDTPRGNENITDGFENIIKTENYFEFNFSSSTTKDFDSNLTLPKIENFDSNTEDFESNSSLRNTEYLDSSFILPHSEDLPNSISTHQVDSSSVSDPYGYFQQRESAFENVMKSVNYYKVDLSKLDDASKMNKDNFWMEKARRNARRRELYRLKKNMAKEGNNLERTETTTPIDKGGQASSRRVSKEEQLRRNREFQALKRQDPSYREKERLALAHKRNNPEYRLREKRAQALRRQDPEFRAREREATRLRREKENKMRALKRQDPQYREKENKMRALRRQDPQFQLEECGDSRRRCQNSTYENEEWENSCSGASGDQDIEARNQKQTKNMETVTPTDEALQEDYSDSSGDDWSSDDENTSSTKKPQDDNSSTSTSSDNWKSNAGINSSKTDEENASLPHDFKPASSLIVEDWRSYNESSSSSTLDQANEFNLEDFNTATSGSDLWLV